MCEFVHVLVDKSPVLKHPNAQINPQSLHLKSYAGEPNPIPFGPKVVPCYGLYVESYKVVPKRNYLGAYG